MQGHQARPINETYSIDESRLLGKGSTGNVYLGFERSHSHKRVAIKAIDLRSIDNEVTRYLLSCQIAALSNLGKLNNTGHENIVKLHDIVLQNNFIYLVMEHLQGGTLADYLKKHPQGLPESEALNIFRQILEGYVHMRNKQIVHRDLKPDNVLFKADPLKSKKVAIIDFGYCQMQQVPNKPQLFYNVGSPKYMSPEAYKQNLYSQKSDIWALGVIFYEMLAGKTCDHGMDMENYLEMIERQGIPLPANISSYNRNILCLMLNYFHNSRLNARQILKQIDSFQKYLNHQQSQFFFLRGSMEEIEPKYNQEWNDKNMKKKNHVFQSLIIPSNSETIRGNFHQTNSSAWNRGQYTFDRRSLKGGNQPPVIQMNLSARQSKDTIAQSQSSSKTQNTDFNSVRDIIHRKPIASTNQHAPYSNVSNRRTSFIKTINEQHSFLQRNTQNIYRSNANFKQISFRANFPMYLQAKVQNSLPQKLDNYTNTIPLAIISNHSVTPQINNHYVNQRLTPSPFQRTQLHSIGTPSNQGIKIKINYSHQSYIQQQKKIQFDNLIEKMKYNSIEKQPVKVTPNLQFFNEKEINLYESSQPVHKKQKSIVNLRPAVVIGGESKIGFAKLQPHRFQKHNPIQNNVPLRQGIGF